jgi:hypothetical protein
MNGEVASVREEFRVRDVFERLKKLGALKIESSRSIGAGAYERWLEDVEKVRVLEESKVPSPGLFVGGSCGLLKKGDEIVGVYATWWWFDNEDDDEGSVTYCAALKEGVKAKLSWRDAYAVEKGDPPNRYRDYHEGRGIKEIQIPYIPQAEQLARELIALLERRK